jgi:hypothetical protein
LACQAELVLKKELQIFETTKTSSKWTMKRDINALFMREPLLKSLR